MCEVVEISDDESSVPEIAESKEESLSLDLPLQNTNSNPGLHDVASSSGINLRSSFIGMGFSPSLVNQAIEENGEGNGELILEALFKYSAVFKSEPADSHDCVFGEDTNKKAYCTETFPLKEEPGIDSGFTDEKVASLLKMNFTFNEVAFAMERLGKCASIGQLMDFIFAARMAKKYEKDAHDPVSKTEENKKDCDNEALFCIMDKTLRLLEMGFSENEISAAFEQCGSEASLADLADSIVAGGTGPDALKCLSTSFSNRSVKVECQSSKRKMGDRMVNQLLDSFRIKTEGCSSGVVTHGGTSDLAENLKGKMPKDEYTDEPSSWKKTKEEFLEDTPNFVAPMRLGSRRGDLISNRCHGSAPQREVGHLGSLEEDRKPAMLISNPCRSLSNVVAKPPYFFYGNIMDLSQDSWVKISKFLYSVQPEFVNTELHSALSRNEGYVHNLPVVDRFHMSPKGPMTIGEALPHTRKWWPSWDNRKHLTHINCDTSAISSVCNRIGRMLAECKELPAAGLQREIMSLCEAKSLLWIGKAKLTPLEPEHLELIMGYPVHHSQATGISLPDRLELLKFSFQTDTLGYHLSVLKPFFPGGITVLSFFSGIGGAEVALHRLGIHLKGVVSVEPSETKRRIIKRWWERSGQRGQLVQIDSIHKLSGTKLDDLLKKFGGFDIVIGQNPCVVGDSSESDGRILGGLDFTMFVEFVRVLQRVRSTMEHNK